MTKNIFSASMAPFPRKSVKTDSCTSTEATEQCTTFATTTGTWTAATGSMTTHPSRRQDVFTSTGSTPSGLDARRLSLR